MEYPETQNFSTHYFLNTLFVFNSGQVTFLRKYLESENISEAFLSDCFIKKYDAVDSDLVILNGEYPQHFSEYLFSINLYNTRSLGALWAPTSSWRPFGPLDFVLRALRALRPCDPRVGDLIVC